jgi:MFS transporter, ACS family, tartrate transporter
MNQDFERRVIRKVCWRLLPLIVLIYFVAYADRTNVGFASFGMTRQFGFSAYIYGWGAGIFFLGYFLFEVPSNLLMQRTGVRFWVARIMITWGIVAAATALTVGPASFLLLRFMLGMAEAGFFPGMILYLTFWFPRAYRARVVAALFLAVPGSNAVTAAASGALLQLDGVWGFPGWQWLFVLEALPAVLLAFAVLAFLTDKPADATWLRPDERVWLQAELDRERRAVVRESGSLTAWQALRDGRVIACALIYLTVVTATYGITFFMPLILKKIGGSDLRTGLLTALPYVVGTIGLVFWSASSDRTRERKWHFIVACLTGAAGLAAAGMLGSTPTALVAMSVATIGLYGAKPAFWAIPTDSLSGPGAASGIAFINSIGNLGGFIGPYVIGWLRQSTATYEYALYFLAACSLLSAMIALMTVRRPPAGVAVLAI